MNAQKDPLVANALYDLTGLVAVMTGGGTGLGLMIIRTLVANGAKVYITDRRLEVLQSAAATHGQNGIIIPIQVNLTIKDTVVNLAREIDSKEPNGIHILVSNTGYRCPEGARYDRNHSKPMLLQPFSPLRPSFRYSPNGTASKQGYASSILNVASIGGLIRSSWPGYYAYEMSKAAELHLSRVLGTMLSQARFRVDTIAPGIFPSDTPYMYAWKDSVPAGRTGNEQEMANAILYLVGPVSCYTNGQTLYPDGGIILLNLRISFDCMGSKASLSAG